MRIALLVLMMALTACMQETEGSTPVEEQSVPESATEPAPEATSAEVALDCSNLPANLESCTTHSCNFTHPFTGETLQKSISLENGVCMYNEQMPNGGELSCEFTEDTRRAVAQFIRAVDAGNEPAENPLEQATASGECVVSGY